MAENINYTGANPDIGAVEADAVATPAPANTVAPSISGTAEVGLTLTGNDGTWTDATSYARQWQRNGADISGATGTTYTLVDADHGATITYQVTATGAGGTTSATSEATAAVTYQPPTNTATPSITGTAKVGSTLTGNDGTWSGTITGYNRQWQRDGADIAGATGQTYTLVAADDGATIAYRVSAYNADWQSAATSNGVAVTYPAPANTTAPSISGTAQVGSTLTGNDGVWSGGGITYSRQWLRDGGAIVGATGQTYALVSADQGTTITYQVTATNDGGSASATSAGVGPVAAQPAQTAPSNTTLPSISGTAKVGQTLTGTDGTWTGSPTSYTRQWLRDGVAIAGATGTTYLLAAADDSHTITFEVTATNDAGSTSATSAATGTVTYPTPINTVLPSITGSATVGSTLTGHDGTWSNTPTSYARQWKRDGVAIAGQTGTTYVSQTADVGHSITYTVTATNDGGSTAATSAGVTVQSSDGFVQLKGDPALLPEVCIEVAFASKPRDYPQTWTAVTDKVRALSTGPRGRQPLADRSEAAQLTLTLDNSDRAFDPQNADGPYYGQLKPNKRVRIRARWNGVIYPVMEALIDEWPQSWPNGGKDAIVSLTGTDKFKTLGRYTLPSTFTRALELPGPRIGSILDAAGQPTQERNLDDGNSNVVALNPSVTADTALTAGSASVYTSDTSILSAGMYVSGPGIPDGATIQSIDSAQYFTLSAAATETLDPSRDQFYTSEPQSPGDGLTTAQKTSDSERGLLFVDADGTWRFQNRNYRLNTNALYTFGDDEANGELPYVDVVPAFTEQDIANDVHVQLPDQAETVSDDMASQDDNGPISLTIDTYLSDRNQAQAIGDYELSRRKDAATRIDTLKLEGASSPESLWPVLLALNISDHILVVRRPPGGGAAQQYECYVENIAHRIDTSTWQTTLQLSPADTSSYWTLGTSVLGTDTRLAV